MAAGDPGMRAVTLLPTAASTGEARRFAAGVMDDWELAGAASADHPLPFALAGGASAQLFLLPSTTAHPRSLRVRVDYGAGTDSGCQPISGVTTRLYGSTVIPGVRTPVVLSRTPNASTYGAKPRCYTPTSATIRQRPQ